MSTLTNIGIIFIVVLLTFFIGLAIVGIVDKRLQDLQINLPKQNIVLVRFKEIQICYCNHTHQRCYSST